METKFSFCWWVRRAQGVYSNSDVVYKRISANLKLVVPNAFDTVDRQSWGIRAYPHMFVIRPDGILHAITGGRDLSVEKIGALLNNEEVNFYPAGMGREVVQEDFVTDNHLRFMSMIRKSKGEHQQTDADLVDIHDNAGKDSRSVSNVPLYGLYNYAYFGRWLWTSYDTAYYGKINAYPVLEVSDKTLFLFDYKTFPSRKPTIVF